MYSNNFFKTTVLVFWVLVVICSFSSCGGNNPVLVKYYINFGIQDASGNDLVKGIESEEWWPGNLPLEEAHSGMVKSDLYTLDIIVFEECKNWDNVIYNAPGNSGFIPDHNYPKLAWGKMDNGYYCFMSGLTLPLDDCPKVKMLTFKLKCPYVFGDDNIHELVTYWKLSGKFAECNRLLLDGREMSQITYRKDDYRTLATIILEK